jgi:hypothetical protein
MNSNEIKRLISIGSTFPGYDDTSKAEFHNLAKKYLKRLASVMELEAGTFTIRSNKGGIAVLGEVTLHSDNLYIQLGGSGGNERFYYRCVKGQKDFTGGRNAWMNYKDITDIHAVAEIFTKHLDANRYEWAA